jgi:hypothetical protein
MTALLLAQRAVGWVAVGMPPTHTHEAEPLSLSDWAFVIGAIVVAFCSFGSSPGWM